MVHDGGYFTYTSAKMKVHKLLTLKGIMLFLGMPDKKEGGEKQ